MVSQQHYCKHIIFKDKSESPNIMRVVIERPLVIAPSLTKK